ncbi:hypothetical protein SAMN05216188_10820 [Lentzea xinjiangensis]|uniref:Uncharacterized protein n=1 Tax=Lentzea xinjiangensis TaxID=402600 RepID=A0A1H9LN15_9PSEU|nr:hypothetical protein SAMN05216188_10820 [Lentzea xinjiangensis]
MLVAGVAVAATLTAVTAAVALAGGGSETGAIVCPQPALPAVPARAQAEVQRELANLDRQLAEANDRLRTSAGEGGPDFVRNAILGPLASKRTAALDRIEIAVGRAGERPQALERFATCGLGAAPAVSAPPSAVPSSTTPSGSAIECPSPVLPAVPAAARTEVDRELANLGEQLAEANERLRTSVGQGGPAFVQNAILGPLASKRTAALDRIEIAVGRAGERPQGLERFATCSLE